MKLYAIVRKGETLDDTRDFYNLYITREDAESDLAHGEFDDDPYCLTEEEEEMDMDDLLEVAEIDIDGEDLIEAFDNMREVERVSDEDAFNELWDWLPDNIKRDFLKSLDWNNVNAFFEGF